MNIAILIGVSDYKTESPLPACSADVAELSTLLLATKKWDEIFCITTNTDSSSLKDSVRSFFAKYQNQNVDEVFVYFSGHGVFHSDDALLCCSDFDYKRPSTTSISNSELDDLLRSVSPAVAVKVIDACQSGSPYIKEVGAGFEKALRTSRLNSFICMASSRQDQSSYASASGSDFTTKWIEAALGKSDGDLLYRDIQAALADAFVSNPDQTPFFVVQGTGLEVFASVTEEMRRLSKRRTAGAPAEKAVDIAEKVQAAVTRLEAAYVSQPQAIGAVSAAGSQVAEASVSDEIVKRFYEKSVTTDGKLSTLPRSRSVAEFADEQGWVKKYFVKINRANQVFRVPRDRIGISVGLLGKRLGDEDFVTETRLVPAGLEATEQLPFEVIEVRYEPKAQALKGFAVHIGLVHSLTEVMVLAATVELTPKGWGLRKPNTSDIQWRYQSVGWPEVVANPDLVWKTTLSAAEGAIRNYLEGLVPKQEEREDSVQLA